MMTITTLETGRHVAVSTPYNAEFVAALKERVRGCRWNSLYRHWVVPADAIDTVRQIMMEVFGETDQPDNSPRYIVRVTFAERFVTERNSLDLFGREIAFAYSSDSGVRLCSGVTLESGDLRSAGNRRRAQVEIAAGTALAVSGVTEAMAKRDPGLPGVTVEIAGPAPTTEGSLVEEYRQWLWRMKAVETELERIRARVHLYEAALQRGDTEAREKARRQLDHIAFHAEHSGESGDLPSALTSSGTM